MELGTKRVLLIIWLFYINNSFCEDKRILAKTYPKIVQPFGKVYIENSGKVVKTKPLNTKKAYTKTLYTVFEPIVQNAKKINVPESPYFPLEQNYENKPRVKKVLPDYVWTSIRNKRSVEEKRYIIGKHEHSKTKVQKKNNTLKLVPHKTKTHVKKSNVSKGKRPERHGKISKKMSKSKLYKRNGLKYSKKHSKRSKRNKNGALRHNKHKSNVRKGKKSNGKSHRNLRGKVPVDGRRIIAGKDAMIEDYPYVVSIQKSGEHWCAGALLNQRIVITTANCLWKSSSISRLRVRAGSRYTDRGGQVAKIQEVMKHPGWSIRRNPDNDVALVLLDKNIKFSDSVHGVDLPNRMMMPAFDDAFITSWGSVRRDGVYESTYSSLQMYHARLLDRTLCNNITQRFGVTVTENFICLTQNGRRAPCTRDSGAPAVSDGVLWGLASWGIRKLCGTERFPAIFTYLASQSNMDFIQNATHYLMADERYYPFPDRVPRMRITTTKPTTVTSIFK